MNTYELADELENYVWMNPNNNRDYCKEVKDMLRQQADYIKHLEQGLESSIALNKAQLERLSDLERKHKEEFDYAEKLLKEQQR
jgi:ABC-type Zn uptake system ZnuABC Zn-binding protein ZnuA